MIWKVILTIFAITPLFGKEPQDKQLVVVLGMHRSGTSLISKGLECLGIDLGDHLLPGDDSNVQGYFEDIDIGRFNETVLFLHNLACHSIKNYPVTIQNRDALLQYGKSLIERKTKDKALFGFKDPRTARNMKLWKEIFAMLPSTKVHVVVIVRHPVSVAKSLYQRNKIDATRAYYMWLQHYISALTYLRGLDSHFIAYEALLQNPEELLKDLATQLEIKITPSTEIKLRQFAQEYVSLSLQHHSVEPFASKEVPQMIRNLYRALNEMSKGNSNKKALLELADAINQDLLEMEPLLHKIDLIENIGKGRNHRFFQLIEELIPGSLAELGAFVPIE